MSYRYFSSAYEPFGQPRQRIQVIADNAKHAEQRMKERGDMLFGTKYILREIREDSAPNPGIMPREDREKWEQLQSRAVVRRNQKKSDELKKRQENARRKRQEQLEKAENDHKQRREEQRRKHLARLERRKQVEGKYPVIAGIQET